jgi:hypothetical protein
MIVRPALGAAAFVLLAAGCAAPTAAQSAPSPSLSYNTVPTRPTFPSPSASVPSEPTTTKPTTTPPPPSPIDRRPSGPPNGPTDNLKKTSWVVGTITNGGTGPCYGLETDEGTQYALYSTAGTKLTKGTRMRINTKTAKVKIYCGPGKLVEMTAAEPLR